MCSKPVPVFICFTPLRILLLSNLYNVSLESAKLLFRNSHSAIRDRLPSLGHGHKRQLSIYSFSVLDHRKNGCFLEI